MRAATLIRAASISPYSEISAMSPRSPTGGNETNLSFYRRTRNTRLSLDRGLSDPLRRVIRSDTDLIGSTPLTPCGVRLSEFFSGGMGNGSKSVGGSGSHERGNGDRGIGSYYQEMLREDPGNPLLLRNYGRFLQEVEGDLGKAEEYYSRAILMSPDDGEVLSLYGRLIWESLRDCKRAEAYYERAVKASPDDCYVLGSYAHFLWDAEDEEEEGRVASPSPLVEAF